MKFEVVKESIDLAVLETLSIFGMDSAKWVVTAMKKRILVLEDEPANRALIVHMLSKDYELILFEDGLDGLAWLENGNKVDLVITDLEMPKMDGFEFISRVGRDTRFQHIGLVITSSLDEKEVRKRLKHKVPYLPKPIEPLILKSTLLKMLQ